MTDPNSSITIRAARAEDAPAIAALHIAAWQWAYRGQLPDAFLDGLSHHLDERIRLRIEAIADPAQRNWLAEDGGALTGFAITHPSRDDDATSATGELGAIYLAEHAAGRGIGRALFERAVADLEERGYEAAILWVLESNTRARRFYERAGWSADGARKVLERPDVTFIEVRYRVDFASRSS
jgi:ribosomal protein S18 acetylase RimI-like enzyme